MSALKRVEFSLVLVCFAGVTPVNGKRFQIISTAASCKRCVSVGSIFSFRLVISTGICWTDSQCGLGRCNLTTYRCVCPTGYSGSDCSVGELATCCLCPRHCYDI